MQVTILTLGTTGDVQPFIALGVGLQRAGYSVRITTDGHFEAEVRSRGLGFRPVGCNVRDFFQNENGQAMIGSGGNPIKMARRIHRGIKDLAERVMGDCWEACRDADALLLGGPAFYAGAPIAEKMGIPFVQGCVQPLTPTRAFSSALLPRPKIPLGGRFNRFTHTVSGQVLWHAFRPTVNKVRQEVLHIEPWPFGGPYGRMYRSGCPILYGFSAHVLPRPSDWADFIHITGYWFLDRQPQWHPPAELVEFLESGPPPVYVGFGSMNNRDPREATELVIAALRSAGQRGVLLPGWGGLQHGDFPDFIFPVESVPHDWLFPRMAAVVHHGGAGTTAAALRAGVPSVVVPFFSDQPFWGRRVMELGAGPRPIPRSRLTAERLANAIRIAVTDTEMRSRAAKLGEKIRGENGVAEAVDTFRHYVGT